MSITVRAAGVLRYRVPGQQENVSVEFRPALRVADVMTELGLRPEKVRVIRVNGKPMPADHILADGDSVELFPIVGGG